MTTAALLGGLLMLLFELRHEHRVALGETWRAWIPLAYAAAMLIAGAVSLALWSRGGRRTLQVGFAAAIAVGVLGLEFHGGAIKGARTALKAWTVPIGKDGGSAPGTLPPPLAPLAFAGLGVLGLLACADGPRMR